MESIASDLRISALKQTTLCKSYEELHSQASTFLAFSLQWKDLESHFDSVRKKLRTEFDALSEHEKALFSREEGLAERESRLESDLASKARELERIEDLIGARSRERVLADLHVDSLKSLISENREELDAKEKEFREMSKAVAEKSSELDRVWGFLEEEKRNLEHVKIRVSEGEGKLLVLEKKIKRKLDEAESKDKDLDSLRKTLRELKDDIGTKDRKFSAIRKNVAEKNKQLQNFQASIEESEKVLKSKEDELKAIQTLITKCSSELELKEKRLDFLQRDIKSKEKNSVDRFEQVLEGRKREIEGLLKELESKIEQVSSISCKVNDCLREVASREESVESLQKSVEKRHRDLQVKEKQFRKEFLDFDLKQKNLALSQKSSVDRVLKENTNVPRSPTKVERLECSKINNNAIAPSSASHQTLPTMKGKDLQIFMNRHLRNHDTACHAAFTSLLASNDPAKLVLDAMEGFYLPRSDGESNEFDLKVVRRSCILLLEQLMRVPMQINFQVKEEAMKLASSWRTKMKEREADYLEALGFLHLSTCYQLIDAFNPNELNRLVHIVGQHGQPTELRQALSKAEDIKPGRLKFVQDLENSLAIMMMNPPNLQSDMTVNILNILHNSPDPAKLVLDYVRGPFSNLLKTGDMDEKWINWKILLEQLLRVSPQIHPGVREEAMKVATEWKANFKDNAGNSSEILVFLQFVDTYELASSFGFSTKIPELIKNMIEQKFVDAFKLFGAFDLTNRFFSPEKILNDYMSDLEVSTTKFCKVKRPIEEKEKATDDELSALKVVRKCVEEQKLSIPLAQIDKRIAMLNRQKIQRRRDFDNAKQQQSLKKRTFADKHQSKTHQRRHKIPRTDV